MMDGFYTNISLKGPEQNQVTDYLHRIGRRALVAPTLGDRTVVFEEESERQDLEVLASVCEGLSQTFGGPALGVLVHDNAMLWLVLYDDGLLVDEYNSTPGYFRPAERHLPPCGGNAHALCSVFEVEENLDALREALLKPALSNGGFDPAWNRHREIARTLNLPGFVVGVGYTSLATGSRPEGLNTRSVMRTDRPARRLRMPELPRSGWEGAPLGAKPAGVKGY